MAFFRYIAIPVISMFLIQIVKGQYITAKIITDDIKYVGTVVDSATNEPLTGVVISDICLKNGQIAVKNYVTNSKGEFSYTAIKAEQRRIEVSCLGYKLHVQPLPQNGEEIHLGKIRLSPDVYKLDEVIIRSRVEMFRISRDTILYFPRSVKTMTGDPVIEILRQMPGVKITDEGDVFIGDKKVERTYLNGRLIFGEDAKTPLKAIDAKDASLIQAYDEPDEKSEILYGKNAQKRRVLNILTFDDFKAIISGEVKLEGGTDRKRDINAHRQERYYGSGKIGFYNEKSQTEASGSIDNRIPSTFNPQNKPGGYRRIRNAGASFSAKPDAVNKYAVNYKYDNNFSNVSAVSNTGYFPTNQFNSQTSERINSNVSEKEQHNMKLSYEFLRKNKISVSIDCPVSFERSDNSSQSLAETFRDNVLLSTISDRSYSELNKYKISPYLCLYKTFTNSSMLFTNIVNINKSDGTGLRDYILDNTGTTETKKLNTTLENSDISSLSKLTCNIGIANHGQLMLESDIIYQKTSDRNLTLNTVTGVLDNALSEDALSVTTALEGRIGYQFIRNKHRFFMKIGYSAISLNYDERLPDLIPVRRNFEAIIPEISYSFEESFSNTLTFSFSGRQIAPYFIFLSTQIRDNDPMFISTGNPNLKKGKEYVFQIQRSKTSQKRKSLLANLSLVKSHNLLIINTIYFDTLTTLPQYGDYKFPAGSILTIPVNSSTSYRITPQLTYETRLSAIKSICKISAIYKYENPQTGTNFKLTRTHRQMAGTDINLTTNFSSRFRAEIKNNTQYTWFKNSSGFIDESLWESAGTNIRWDLGETTYLTGSYTVEYYRNNASDLAIENHILNASIGCRLFKSRKGSVSFNAYDILDRTSNISTTVNDQYVTNTSKPLFSSYFTIAFEYRFTNSK